MAVAMGKSRMPEEVVMYYHWCYFHQYLCQVFRYIDRSKFESFQLTLPEIIICLLGRCDAYTQSKDYLNAYLDSEILCQLAANVPDNHLRKGVCNLNLGNLLNAKTDFERGLCFNNKHPILLKMLQTVNELIDFENGDL